MAVLLHSVRCRIRKKVGLWKENGFGVISKNTTLRSWKGVKRITNAILVVLKNT